MFISFQNKNIWRHRSVSQYHQEKLECSFSPPGRCDDKKVIYWQCWRTIITPWVQILHTMLMGCTPVLPGWVLEVWGFRGGHISWWGALRFITGKKFGRGGILGYLFYIINAESCTGWKPHKLEGLRGLNNFFTRLGVTTEFCRGDTNVSGVHWGDTNVSGVHPGWYQKYHPHQIFYLLYMPGLTHSGLWPTQ